MKKQKKTSFFGQIQSHLKTQHSGRLMSLILVELGRREPQAFVDFINSGSCIPHFQKIEKRISRGDAQFETEWRFENGRFADVAVLLDGAPVIVIEVKEDDLNSEISRAQLADYLEWVESNPQAHFIHFSRYFPQKASSFLKRAIKSGRVHDLRYRDLHRAALANIKRQKNVSISFMCIEYLEEIGVINYRNIDLEKDRKALTFLVIQMAGFPHSHGMGRHQSAYNTSRAPILLGELVGNATALGEWLYNKNSISFANSPSSRFKCSAGYAPDKLANATGDIEGITTDENIAQLPDEWVEQGILTVFTRAKLNKNPKDPNNYCYIEMGYQIIVGGPDKCAAQIFLYAQAFWKTDYIYEASDWIEEFPSEALATEVFSKLLKKVLKKSLKSSAPKALANVQVPGAA